MHHDTQNRFCPPAMAAVALLFACALTACGSSSTGGSAIGPKITFTAQPKEVTLNGTSILSWSVEGACQASGGWSGSKGSVGAERTPPIMVPTPFNLTCTSTNGGVTTASITVAIIATPGLCNDPLARNKGQAGACDYTYLSPEGVFPDGSKLQSVPANSLSATVTQISPAPGSVLHVGQIATIRMVFSVASTAPVLDPAGYTTYWNWVDQTGKGRVCQVVEKSERVIIQPLIAISFTPPVSRAPSRATRRSFASSPDRCAASRRAARGRHPGSADWPGSSSGAGIPR